MLTLDLNKNTATLNMTKEAPNFKTIRGILNWDIHPVKGASIHDGFDLDIFAFLLNDQEKVTSGSDVVYFGNKSSQGVSVPVDNRTGEGDDDEHIDMKLNEVPADKKFIDVYVIIFNGANKGQNFGMMANSSFLLKDVENNVDIAKYNLSQYTTETAIHIGRFTRNGSEWTFDSVGAGGNADGNQVLSAYA